MSSPTLKITALNIRQITARLGSASIIVVGIGGVVAVLIGLLSMSQGFQAAMNDTSRPDRAIVLRNGATDELNSWFVNDETGAVTSIDGILAISPEMFVVADLESQATGKPAVAIIRGVTETAFSLRPEIKVTAGRHFQPGRHEMVAGATAVATYTGLALGASVPVRDSVYEVVGIFASGTTVDSELWVDLASGQSTFRRQGSVSSLRVRLAEGAQAAVAAAVDNDPRLKASLVSEGEFYQQQSRSRAQLIESFAYLVAFIMAIGAIVTAANVMHTAVGARSKEIATLRAIGFGRAPIVISILAEALLLSLLGGLFGGALVYLAFDGYATSTLQSGSLSQVAFQFSVTPQLVATGLAWSVVLGFVCALVPAVRGAHVPITDGLRGS